MIFVDDAVIEKPEDYHDAKRCLDNMMTESKAILYRMGIRNTDETYRRLFEDDGKRVLNQT